MAGSVRFRPGVNQSEFRRCGQSSKEQAPSSWQTRNLSSRDRRVAAHTAVVRRMSLRSYDPKTKARSAAQTLAGLIFFCLGVVTMKNVPHSIRLRAVDFDRIRPYFRDLEFLAREASTSGNPQVLITALCVLALQSRTISELLQ